MTWEARKKKFQNRLSMIQSLELNAKLFLIDIRRRGSGSINGEWCSQYRMCLTIKELGPDFDYIAEAALANTFGGTKTGLEKYRAWLMDADPWDPQAMAMNRILQEKKDNPGVAFVLMCSEWKPEKCHRSIVGAQLVAVPHSTWKVLEHL